MGLNNDWKMGHLQSLLDDKEVAVYAAAVKDLPEADLKAQLKTIRAEKINAQIAALQKELSEL